MSPGFLRPSGVRVLGLWFMCGTDALQMLSRMPLLINCGMGSSLISHLRVWGCTAYVHIQKDKRDGLRSHMEKCVFIGYPQGYKGWKFSNPTTKKVVISERADFDERYFPMSKHPTSASFPPPSLEVENTPSTTPPPAPRPSLAVPKPDSNPYYFPPDSDDSDSDSDDESSSDESLDHGGDIGTPATALMALGNWSLDPKGRRSLAPSGSSRSSTMQTAL